MVILLHDIAIQVTRKAIKRMHLRINPYGEVSISAPLHCSLEGIHHFIKEKSSWISFHHQRLRKEGAALLTPLQSGCMLPFKGEPHYLLITEQAKTIKIHADNGFIYCTVPPKTTNDKLISQLDNWYKAEMSPLLAHLIEYWSAVIGVQVKQWGIKKMKTRWGSCNIKTHRIWLNLNLIKKPVCCLEYVVVHELIHLLEPSHNHRFYQLMERFLPQWRKAHYVLEGKKARR
ncbi:MAG: zinc metalloprotease [Legionella sp.]|nr:MAG: zinc metalloprotease [Legionella sp.]PJE00062.1 MAG: zinc metalloprotease [Legionella sp.]